VAVPSDYPSQWETHAVLKDGSTVELRPIKASDRDALEAFHGRQSQESIYFRFFRYRPELSDRELDYFTQVDYRDRMAFVAVLGQELVAVARYEKWQDRNTAEVAFFVDDGHHGKGLATLMLEFLAAAARDRGLTGFNATVLPENYRMLAVFRSAGFDVSTRFTDGHIEVELSIEVTAETSMAIADRQRLATARSVARIDIDISINMTLPAWV
jgi:RimJ/RimL family protein N-acetyltransferase